MLNKNEILETIDMIDRLHFDVRTVTMGISLIDCISDDGKRVCRRVYDKLMKKAEKLVEVSDGLSKELGIPIVNKRISVTPISVIGASSLAYCDLGLTLDRVANELGIDFIGGYSALLQKGITPAEAAFMDTIPTVLSTTEKVCSSLCVGSSKAGINMDAVRAVGKIIKRSAELTCDRGGMGAAKFVAFCNAVEDNPFMAGAFNGISEGDCMINVGVSGPGVVNSAVSGLPKTASLTEVAETVKKTAFKITRVGQIVAALAASRLNAEFGIVDLSLAPTPVVGDSVADILEAMGLEVVGTHGTTAALALLNDAVKKGGIMASSSVGGLSGAFIPVSEDRGMINAVTKGALSLDKLEAMTSVCSVGLDMIAVEGDTSADTISAILADEAAIGMINNKTTAVRLIPVPGKRAGERVEFGGLLGEAPIISVGNYSASVFINRGGRIPAPVHSNKN